MSYQSVSTFEDKQKMLCREVQRDPYSHFLTNSEKQNAKLIPLRMTFNFLAAGIFSIYYLSRNHEINRIKNLKISFDMIVNVGSRSALAFVVSDLFTRKMFVNYDRITQHKVANNEIRKIMR